MTIQRVNENQQFSQDTLLSTLYQWAKSVAIQVNKHTDQIDRNPVTPETYGGRGDGATNDGPAVLAAAATGKDVYFNPDRTYLVNGATIVPVSGQRFWGGGKLKKTTTANDLTPAGAQDAPKFFHLNSVDDVTISGLRFEYTGATTPRVYGITIENCDRTTICNNSFDGNETPIFVWKNSRWTNVVGNRSHGGVFGIATGGDGVGNTSGPVEDTVIAFNTLTGAISEGIDVNWDTQGCLIFGNVLADNSGTASEEDIDIGGGDCHDIWVVSNKLDGAGRSLSAIKVKLVTTRIHILNNDIRNGLIGNANSRAIYFDASAGLVSHCEARGNTIDGYCRGITAASGVEDITIKDNPRINITSTNSSARAVEVLSGANKRVWIDGNTALGNDTAGGSGIHIADVVGYSANRNKISGFAGDGITAFATASRGDLIENKITACDDGVVCLSPYSKINGNTCFENDKNGVNVQADYVDCSHNTIHDNGVVTDGSYGLVLTAGADFCTLVANRIYDTRGASARQNGLTVTGACDRCILMSNLIYNNKTTNVNGTGSLTNSIYSTSENVVA